MLLPLEKMILPGQSWESQMDVAGVAVATPPKETESLPVIFRMTFVVVSVLCFNTGVSAHLCIKGRLL